MWRWLVTVVLLVEGRGDEMRRCPTHCSCYRDTDGYLAADCTPTAISPHYQQVFPHLDLLHLTPLLKSTPVRLTPHMFVRFRNLKVLNLANASVSQIPHEVFAGLRTIFDIDLSYNRIRHLKGSVFQDLPQLQTLILRGNPLVLTHFDRIISDSLRELDMGECSLKTIPENWFMGVERLTHLSLDRNQIQTISFRTLPNYLRYLSLADNKITNVPLNIFLSMSFLRMLDLSGNPINCTCHLLVMQDWFSGRGITFEKDIICDTPNHYHGQRLNKINEDELCKYEMRERARRERHINKIRYNDYLIRDDNKRNIFEHEVMADAPAPDSEVVFTNERTRSLGTHMEHKKELDTLEESLEASGAGSDDVSSSLEETTLLSHDSDSAFANSQEELDNITLSSDHHSEEITTESEFSISDEKTESLESEGSATLPASTDIEGSGDIDNITEISLLSSERTASEVELSSIETEKSLTTTEEGEVHATDDYITNITEHSTELTSSDSSVSVSLLDVHTEHHTTESLTEVTEVFESQTVKDILERYSDMSTEASVGNVTADGILSADMSNFYQSVGTYILVGIIVVPIILLILMAIYKKRSPRKIRLPQDTESNLGTELQDMDTLLPKNGAENGVKVVAKANGAANPSDCKDPEEVRPVLEAPSNEENALNLEESPSRENRGATAPIERTKAKLTVLPDSIPKTPVFIHKP